MIKNLQDRLEAGKALVLRNSFRGENENEGEKIAFPFACLFVNADSKVWCKYIQSMIEDNNGTQSFVMNTAGPY